MRVASRLRVFLVEDHPLMLFGLQRYLENRYEVVGSASETSTAVEMVNERLPDLVLVDISVPGGGGAVIVEEVKKRHPDIKFLAFTVSTSAEDVVSLFRAGVDGYVVKSVDGLDLEEQIEQVMAGGRPISRQVAGHLLTIDDVVADQTDLEQLTPREREVVTLIARGFKYREAADELGISRKTLETHMQHIFEKLGVASRHEITYLAFETGFLKPGDLD